MGLLSKFLTTLLFASLLLASPARSGKEPPLSEAESKALGAIESKVGKVVKGTQLPEMRAHLNAVFERVSEAQVKLFPHQSVPINSVYLLDSPIENAFVMRVPDVRNPSKSTHMVFVTTGMFEALYPSSGMNSSMLPQDLELGESRLAGVLSHELGHPFDNSDSVNNLSWFERQTRSQAGEIITDLHGVSIAEVADYPRDGLYSALDALNPGQTRGGVSNGISTHPEHEFRQSAGRMKTTQLHFNRGAQRGIRSRTRHSSALMKEVKALKAKSLRAYQPPQTIEEAATRILKVQEDAAQFSMSNTRIPRNLYEVEFNRLLIDLDRMIAEKKGVGLTEAEWEIFHKALGDSLQPGRMSSKSRLHVFNRQRKNVALNSSNGSVQLQKLPSHEEYLQTSWVYQAPEHQQWVKEKLGLNPETTGFLGGISLHNHTLVQSPKNLFEKYGDALVVAIRQSGLHELNEIEKMASTETKIRLAHLFHEKAFSTDVFSKHSVYKVENAFPSTLFALTKGGKSQDPFDAADFRELSAETQEELRRLRKQTLKKIWENAGFWGVMDIGMASENVDWKLIWKELGLPEALGRQELNKRVRKFVASPAYRSVIRKFHFQPPGDYKDYWSHSYKRTPTDWMDRELAELLLSDDTPGVSHGLKQAVYSSNPALLKQRYQEELHEALAQRDAAKTLDLAEVERIHNTLVTKLLPGKTFPVTVDEAWAVEVDRLNIPDYVKRNLFRDFYMGSAPFPAKDKKFAKIYKDLKKAHGAEYHFHPWHVNGGFSEASDFLNPHTRQYPYYYHSRTDKGLVARILKKNGLITSVSDFLEESMPAQRSDNYIILSSFSDEVVEELDALKNSALSPNHKKRRLETFVSKVIEPKFRKPGERTYQSFDYRQVQRVQAKALEVADTLPLTFDEKKKLFDRLTSFGGHAESDRYFRKHFLTGEAGKTADSYRLLEWSLNHGRIESAIVASDAADILLRHRVGAYKSLPPSTTQIADLLKQVNAWVPHATLARDELLEKMAWKLQLRDGGLRLLEDYKSYNPHIHNPNMARLGSVYSGYASRLAPSERLALMEYILNPEKVRFPLEVEDAIGAMMLEEEILKEAREAVDPETITAKRNQLKENLHKTLIDSRPSERIPALEILIQGGPNNLTQAADFPLNITRPLFKSVKPDSVEEKLLRIFLKNVDAGMRSTALSMLLTQQLGGGAIDLARIYEAFGPFGIRFAQMVSRWDLFGPEHSAQIEHLKYNAKPLTLKEVESIAQDTLTAAEMDRIDHFIEMKGSGTNRAVVKVRLKGGSTPVMMVQRPFAREQIDTVTDLARRALIDAKAEKLFDEIELVDLLIRDTHEQMLSELVGKEEVVRIRRAHEFYDRLNHDPGFKKILQGYEFEVPLPLPDNKFKVYDNLFFMEHFDGDVFSKLPAGVQDMLGEPIARSSVEGRLMYGVGNVDLHKGNVLGDPVRKKIGMIDTAGWWYELSDTDRLAWRDFLVASSTQDSKAALEAGLKLTDAKPTAAQIDAIEDGITEAFRTIRRDPTQLKKGSLLIQKAFELNGAHIRPSIKFGGLMEFLVVAGEGYVKPDQLKAMLAETVMKSYALPMSQLSPVDCTIRGILMRTVVPSK